MDTTQLRIETNTTPAREMTIDIDGLSFDYVRRLVETAVRNNLDIANRFEFSVRGPGALTDEVTEILKVAEEVRAELLQETA